MVWLLLVPGSPGMGKFFFEGEDKLIHFVLFMVWSFLMTFRTLYSMSARRVILYVLVISLMLGAGTEVLQGIIPNRSRDLFDFVADMVGAGTGVVLALIAKRLLHPQ